ncbi:hypothetical protein L1049_021531 [Liquidambar formosana]|uniref:Uncharacterized protein n=1 Tax=Liquidambar formosana TaxID=63359 RepID=A0AAP0R3V1_LIQFO
MCGAMRKRQQPPKNTLKFEGEVEVTEGSEFNQGNSTKHQAPASNELHSKTLKVKGSKFSQGNRHG